MRVDVPPNRPENNGNYRNLLNRILEAFRLFKVPEAPPNIEQAKNEIRFKGAFRNILDGKKDGYDLADGNNYRNRGIAPGGCVGGHVPDIEINPQKTEPNNIPENPNDTPGREYLEIEEGVINVMGDPEKNNRIIFKKARGGKDYVVFINGKKKYIRKSDLNIEGVTLAIHGGSGNDRINARAVEQHAQNGRVGVRIMAGAGNDRIVGSSGRDVIVGGDGNDRIIGGLGVDTILADDGDGVDRISGGREEDIVYADDHDRVNDPGQRDQISRNTPGVSS